MYFSLYSKAVFLAFVLVGFPHLPLNHNNNKKNIQRSKSSGSTCLAIGSVPKERKSFVHFGFNLCSLWSFPQRQSLKSIFT